MDLKKTSFDQSLIVVSILIAFVITLFIFFVSNVFIDWKLKQSFKEVYDKNFKKIYDTKSSVKQVDSEEKMDKIKAILDNVADKVKKELKETRFKDQRDFWESICLYHSIEAKNWSEADHVFSILPVLTNTSTGLTDLKKILEEIKIRFAETENHSMEELLVTFSPVLTDLGNDSWFRVRRYLNGVIQFFTVWLTLTGLIQIFYLFIKIRNEHKFIKGPLPFLKPYSEKSVFASNFSLFPTSTLSKNVDDKALEEYLFRLGETEKKLHGKKKFFSVFKSLLTTVEYFKDTGNIESASSYFKNSFQEFRDEANSRWEIIRYITWAVPSIGFIGTVLGIGDALGNAHEVIIQNGTQQAGAVQMITASLGTAFDTTLIALFCSIILMLFFHLGTRNEDKTLNSLYNDIDEKLIQKFRGKGIQELFQSMMEKPMEDMVQIFQKIWTKNEVTKMETMLSQLKKQIGV